MTRLLFDTESDGFVEEATKVHCIGAVDVDTGATYDFKPDQIQQGLELLSSADVLIAHNGLRHDMPLLRKLYPEWKPQAIVRDTMVIARLIYPNIRDTDAALVASGQLPRKNADGDPMIGKHTIEAWGHRLGEPKGSFKGPWDQWTPTMHDYMVQDVKTNLHLWNHLQPDKYSQEALQLEHDIQILVSVMEKYGVPFDMEKAGKLHTLLIGKKHEIEERLKAQFKFWLAPISPTTERFLFTPKKDNKKLGYVAGQQCCKLKIVEFNPGSRDHIAKVLMDRGWKPKSFTAGGKPEIDESVVTSAAAQYPEAEGLAEYLTLDKRLSQLADGDQAWLKHVKPDGAVHGVINPMGTGTSRASHFFPNLAQVPAVKSPYGKQCRELFHVRQGFKMLGADMEGLEGRAFAHYLTPIDGGSYGEAFLKGDPHWQSCKILRLVGKDEVRDKASRRHTIMREAGAKRFYYAFIYGCWDLQAGTIILDCCNTLRRENPEWADVYQRFFGTSKSPSEKLLRQVGRDARERFVRETPGLEELKKRVKKQIDKYGWLPGLDKRRIPAKSEHSALNYLIQGAGAVLCKRWGVDAFADLKTNFKVGWDGDFVPMLWVHDEYQLAVREGLETTVGEIVVKHARAAGEQYGFRLPLDSKYTVGRNWADTH